MKLRAIIVFLILFYTTNKAQTVESVFLKLKEEDTQLAVFSFCDLMGNTKELVLPIDHVEKALKDGLTFDSSSIAGYASITESDMILKPDLSTLRFIPWAPEGYKTAWFICDVYKNTTERYEADPRYILQKLTKELEAMGYIFNVGPELEFFLFKRDSNGNPTTQPVDAKKYFDPETNYTRQQENKVIIYALKSAGVNVEKLHHEVAPGQHEFSIKYGDAVSIADQIMIAKQTLKVLAQQLNMHVTFMPKPLFGQNGSGMHIHFSLYDIKNKNNAFFSDNSRYHLSPVAQYFIAGILSTIKQLSALLNPTVNSYKRLVPGYEAPIYICWGSKNRSALIRIPLIHESEAAGMRAEIRCPDASSNPYLAFAALLKSGLEGIKQKTPFVDQVTDNLYKLSAKEIEQRSIKALPTNLHQALQELSQSQLAFELLGTKGLSEFLTIKQKEWQDYCCAVTNWELEKYL